MALEIGKGISEDFLNALNSTRKFIENEHKLFSQIGLQLTRLNVGEVEFSLTLSEKFCEAPDIEGKTHLQGGIFTIVLDTILAYSVNARLGKLTPMATINLKTDHHALALPGEELRCTAKCVGIRDEVAFCNGSAVAVEGDRLITAAAGTFMLNNFNPSIATRL